MQTIYTASMLVGIGGPISAALWKFGRAIEKRVNDFEHHQIRVEEKLHRIEEQFGPNGGGLREAVNNIGKKVDVIESRTNELCADVSELTGRFDQHIVEGNRV